MTSLPALMMSITVTPGFRSRRESATLSQRRLGVTVLGFYLETEKCLYTCDAFNWEKELGYEDIPLHPTPAGPQRVVGFAGLVDHGFTVLHGVYLVRPETFFQWAGTSIGQAPCVPNSHEHCLLHNKQIREGWCNLAACHMIL